MYFITQEEERGESEIQGPPRLHNESPLTPEREKGGTLLWRLKVGSNRVVSCGKISLTLEKLGGACIALLHSEWGVS